MATSSRDRDARLFLADPTFARHPAALALRQLADQIDARAAEGLSGGDAVKAVPARERAAVAALLGFADSAVAVALQDVAGTLLSMQPTIERGMNALEREAATVEATEARIAAEKRVDLSTVSQWAAFTEFAKTPVALTLVSILSLVLGAVLRECGVEPGASVATEAASLEAISEFP